MTEARRNNERTRTLEDISVVAGTLGVSYALGVALGATDRATGEGWIPCLPLIFGISLGESDNDRELMLGAACYAAYGIGIATAYADKLYSVLRDVPCQ